MKHNLPSLAILIVIVLCASSNAAVINLTVTNMGTPSYSYSGGTATATGFTAFWVQATSPDGVIGGFDFSANSGTITGRQISATLLQDWGASGNPSATSANLPGASRFDAVDSSFLLNTATAIVGQGAAEDNNQLGTGLGSPPISSNNDPNHDFGTGTYLSGAWAYQTANQLATQNVAYLVISNSELAASGGTLTVATPQVSWLDTAGDTSDIKTMFVPLTITSVPEPASLGLLALGSLTLLYDRRRAWRR